MPTPLETVLARIPAIPADPSHVGCPKCSGSGRYVTYSPYTGRKSFEGPCFNCNGRGHLPLSKVEGSRAARQRTAIALHTVESIIMLAVQDGDDDRAEFYLQRVVREDMFYIGKRNARKVLDAIDSGAWLEDCSMSPNWGERGAVESETAAKWRARAIEIGREVREQATAE